MFDPEYMDIQGICSGCAACAICAACAACLFDGPIPDFEGVALGGLVGVSGVASW
jgi:hypothetical protein